MLHAISTRSLLFYHVHSACPWLSQLFHCIRPAAAAVAPLDSEDRSTSSHGDRGSAAAALEPPAAVVVVAAAAAGGPG